MKMTTNEEVVEGIILKKYIRKKVLFPLKEEYARKLNYYKSAKF